MVEINERLFLTADEKVVPEGHPDAAFLWASPGDEVDDDEADRVGYKPAKKAAKKSSNKATRPAGNK